MGSIVDICSFAKLPGEGGTAAAGLDLALLMALVVALLLVALAFVVGAVLAFLLCARVYKENQIINNLLRDFSKGDEHLPKFFAVLLLLSRLEVPLLILVELQD
jgi:hypothetical protein